MDGYWISFHFGFLRTPRYILLVQLRCHVFPPHGLPHNGFHTTFQLEERTAPMYHSHKQTVPNK